MFKLVVLSTLLALAAAKPSGIGPLGLAPWGLAGHLAAPLIAAPVAAPVVAAGPLVAAPVVAAAAGPVVAAAPLHPGSNYRGPVSLAPGQPASILAADGRPLDTLNVNVDRAVHYTARAIDHAAAAHYLGKRSAPLLGHAAAISQIARVDWPARVIAPVPIAVPGALGLHAPIAPLALGHAAHLGRHW